MSQDKARLNVRINADLKEKLRQRVDKDPSWRNMTHLVEVVLHRFLRDGEED